VLAAGTFVAVAIDHGANRSAQPSQLTSTLTGLQYATTESNAAARRALSLDAAAVTDRVNPALVVIDAESAYGSSSAAGTGMVLTPDGYVLTNKHVVEGAGSINVTDIGNHRIYPATVTGYDRTHDIALLHLLGASGLTPIQIGNAASVVRGQHILGIGNTGGTGTMRGAGGTITALGDSITAVDTANGSTEDLTGLLRTDAEILPGDSGGPLVDARGSVIGMTVASSAGFVFSDVDHEAYAIPINAALDTARKIAGGSASATVHVGPTAFLGVMIAAPESAPTHLPPAFHIRSNGSTIVGVVSGGPAQHAGLQAGDTILTVAGRAIGSAAELTDVMLRQAPNATIAIDYLDSAGTRHTVQVKLAEGPPQ
jgi:S1-C subfamily serine protease